MDIGPWLVQTPQLLAVVVDGDGLPVGVGRRGMSQRSAAFESSVDPGGSSAPASASAETASASTAVPAEPPSALGARGPRHRLDRQGQPRHRHPPRAPSVGPVEAADTTTVNRATTSSSAVWVALQMWGNRAASFAVFVVLGHLLAPADFGLVAVASAFVGMTGLLLDRGLTAALIQRKEVNQRILSTGFWVGIITGCLLGLLVCLCAPLVAAWLRQPRLTGLLIVLAFSFPCSAVEMVPQALLQRQFQFKTLAVRRLAAVAVSAVVGLSCAIAGAGPYSLVIQSLSFSLTSAAVLWLTSGWRPSRIYDRRAFRETRSFSLHIFFLNLLDFGLTQSDKLLLGPLVGPVSLGYYVVSQKIQLTVQDVSSTVIGSIAFPTFSRLRHDVNALRGALLRMSKMTSITILPVFFLLGSAAKDIVPTVFGQQWVPTVHLTEILSAVAAVGTFTLFDRAILLSLARPRTEIIIVASAAVANAIVIFALHGRGITVVGFGLLARAVIFYPIRVRVMTGVVGLPTWEFIKQSVSSLAAGTLGSAAVLGIQRAAGPVPVVVRIVAEGITFIALYVGALLVIDRPGLSDALGAIGDAVGTQRFAVLRRLQVRLDG